MDDPSHLDLCPQCLHVPPEAIQPSLVVVFLLLKHAWGAHNRSSLQYTIGDCPPLTVDSSRPAGGGFAADAICCKDSKLSFRDVISEDSLMLKEFQGCINCMGGRIIN